VTWILLTNDDGIAAPALIPMARTLGEVAEIRVVAPAEERSWVGKAITRYEPVLVEPVTRSGIRMHSCSGFPADCVQVAIGTMYGEPPALVVSGINLGYNHGTAYIQSSGTVGAALEAGLLGVDGLALSTGVAGDFGRWRRWALSDDSAPMWERLAAVTADLASGMLRAGRRGLTLSVNLPDDASIDTERRLTTVADTGYDALFREEAPGVYVHDYRGGLQNRSAVRGTDVDAAADGVVSITPIRSLSADALPPDLGPLLGIVGSVAGGPP
jgi:5'-nucleotidase